MTETIVDESIPTSFTASVDRPFEMIGKRTLYENEMIPSRNNERLTDEQIKEVIENPEITVSTRLEDLTRQANAQRESQLEEEKIYNMSVKNIAYRTSDTVHNIIDDIVEFNSQDGIRGLLHIFTKTDRLVYIGILIVAFTIILLLIRTTD